MNRINELFLLHVNHPVDLLDEKGTNVLSRDAVQKSIVAFIYNLGLVANQSKCYYHAPQEVNHQRLLNFYIDGFTILLSIGKQLYVENIKQYSEIPKKNDPISQFLIVNNNALQLAKTFHFIDYQNVVDDYLVFGITLGLSIDDIIDAYHKS